MPDHLVLKSSGNNTFVNVGNKELDGLNVIGAGPMEERLCTLLREGSGDTWPMISHLAK